VWARSVVAHAHLSLGLPANQFIVLYCKAGRLVFNCVMSGSIRSCAYVRPRMLLVCAVRFRVAISCRICPRVVVMVRRVNLIVSASVASIEKTVGSDRDMTKLVFWMEVSFWGWARIYEPSGACFRVVEDCVCVVVSSRIDERNASAVIFACCIARRM